MAENKTRRFDAPGDLGRVYEQYTPELKGYIARRTNSPEETEDILQDVFFKLAKADVLENPIESVSAWLYRAVTNRIIDRYRKKREEPVPETPDSDEDDYIPAALSACLADESNDPEALLRNELIREEIAQALSELPIEQRSVFELTEYDGLPYAEISESTGIPVATLLSRKRYAVNHLKKRLAWLYSDL